MAAIQKNVVKWGKRNPVSRLLCLKRDEEAIANWVLSLDEIGRALDVRLSTVVLAISNRLSQAELAVGTDTNVSSDSVVVPEIHHDVSSSNTVVFSNHHNLVHTHPITAEVRHDTAGTHNTGPKVHRDPLKDTGEGDKTRPVGHFSALWSLQSSRLPPLSLMPG